MFVSSLPTSWLKLFKPELLPSWSNNLEIYFYGHSLSKNDYSYFQSIIFWVPSELPSLTITISKSLKFDAKALSMLLAI